MANKAEFAVELEDDVTPGAKRASGSLGRLQKAFDKFNKSTVGKAAGKLATGLKNVVTVAAAVGAGVAAAVGAMTVSMIDFNQRSMMAFKLLAKDGEKPQELFERSIALAKRFGLDMKETTKQVSKFRALQFSQDQSEALIKMGADMQALGASSEEVSRIFLQLGQIAAKGKLQGEELIVLAENGLSVELVYKNLEKQLGKTREEILKMQQAGQIDSKAALNAIGAAVLTKTGTKQFGEAGEMAANATLSGMGGRLKASFDDMFRRASLGVEAVVVRVMGPISEQLFALFNDPATSSALGSAVNAVGEAIEKAMPIVIEFIKAFSVGAKETFPILKDALMGVAEMFGSAGSDGENMARIARTIGKSMGQLAVFIGGTIVVLGALAGVIMNVVGAAVQFWQRAWNLMIDTLGTFIFGVTDFFASLMAIFNAEHMSIGEKFFEIGKALVMGLVNGIKSMASVPGNIINGMINSYIQGAKDLLGIASPSKVFEDIGHNVVLGMDSGMTDMPTIKGMTSQLSSGGMPSAQPNTQQSNTFSPVIHVTAAPGATRADGEALGSGLMAELRRQYRSGFLEDAAIEMGV